MYRLPTAVLCVLAVALAIGCGATTSSSAPRQAASAPDPFTGTWRGYSSLGGGPFTATINKLGDGKYEEVLAAGQRVSLLLRDGVLVGKFSGKVGTRLLKSDVRIEQVSGGILKESATTHAGGQMGNVTTTTRWERTSGSSPSPSSPTPSPPTAVQQLQQYFAAILPAFVSNTHAGTACQKAAKVFNAHDEAVSAYPAYRKVVEKTIDAITSEQVTLSAVTPPPGLEKAHANLLKAWQQEYALCVFLSEKLRLKQPYSNWWRDAEARVVAWEETYHLWLVAVKAEALKLGVRIPAKLRAVM